MSSASYSGRAGTSYVDALDRPGWLTFASVVMFAFGVLRVISAIYYFADSNRVNNLTLGMFGHNLWVWGLWDLVIAALALYAGWSLLTNRRYGRVAGYLFAFVVIIQSFSMIGWAPWWGFASLLLSVFVIYALSVTGEWEANTGLA